MLRVKYPDTEEPQREKIEEILKLLQLGFTERRTAERYLRGESGETALRGLKRRDMEQEPMGYRENVRGILDGYCAQEQSGEAARFFHLLYALYGSSLEKCVVSANSRFWRAMESGDIPADMSRALTVDAQYAVPRVYLKSGQVAGRRYLRASDLESMAGFVRYDLRAVRQALKEYPEKYYDVKMILYTLYFYMRSGRTALNAGRSIWDSTHSLGRRRSEGEWALGGIKKRAMEKDGPPAVIGSPGLDSADKALLKEYEDVMVSALGQVFLQDASGDAVFRDIQNRIRLGQFPGEQLPRLRGRAINDAIFILISGCAYANYRISQRLRGVVAVCAAAAPEEVLWMSHHMNEYACLEDGMEENFGIPVQCLLAWVTEWVEDGFDYRTAVDMDGVNVWFRSQFRKYPYVYLDAYKHADYFVAYVMARAIREEDYEVYRREVLSRSAWQQDRIIDMLLAGGNSLRESRSYLEGRLELSALQAAGIHLGGKGIHNDLHRARMAVEWYDETYSDEQFYSRCMAYMALRECDEFFRYVRYVRSDSGHAISMEQMTLHTFQGLALAGIKLPLRLHIACTLAAEAYEEEDYARWLIPCLVSVFQEELAQRPQETRAAFAAEGAYGRYLALLIYAREERREEIFAYSLDPSKMIRRELVRILTDRPHLRPQVTELLSSKKAAQRETGVRVLAAWDTPQDRAALWQLQEREKNASVLSLLEEVLSQAQEREEREEKGACGRSLTRGELVKALHRGGRRRSLAWAYETPFSPVHRAGGGWAGEEYLQALLLCYSSMKEPGQSSDAALLAEKLDPRDLAVYMNELLDRWLAAGGEAKKRWVVYAAAIHGDGAVIRKLQHQIRQWARHSRSALAAETWRGLFVDSPVMHMFAMGLIWGVYGQHRLVQSFRYMEDGSFNTENEEEYALPEQGRIGLVHPLELSPESVAAWRGQLEDYEITQPIEQLGRTVYSLDPREQEARRLERFTGRVINDLALGGRLTALGWQRGPVGGGGRYCVYFREEPLLGLGAELHFSGSMVGNGAAGGQDVTVGELCFYRIGTVDRGPESYDLATEGRQLSLKNIPRRFFSEIAGQIDRATASG